MRRIPVLFGVTTEKESPWVFLGSTRRLHVEGLTDGHLRVLAAGCRLLIEENGFHGLPEETERVRVRFIPANGKPTAPVTVDLVR